MDKKIVFITGAAKGIGASCAELFSKNGYDVIIHYNKNKKLAEELKTKLEKIYLNNIYLIQGDLINEDEIKKIVSQIQNITNHVDVLINNAALSIDSYFLDKTSEEFSNVLNVNLVAPFLLIKLLFNNLINGVIINICSTDGIDTGGIYNIDYSASKSGLITLTKILGNELKNIRVYAVAPNWVKTESVLEMEPEFLMQELKRVNQNELLHPEVVANRIFEIVNNDSLPNGMVVRMDGNNE